MKKRWVWPLIIFTLLVGVWLSIGSLQLKMMEWYLTGYCQKYFDHSLTYEKSQLHSDGTISIEGVTLRPANQSYSLHIDRLIIDSLVDWPGRLLYARLSVVRPTFQLLSVDVNPTGTRKAPLTRPYFFLRPKVDWEIIEGNVVLGEKSKDRIALSGKGLYEQGLEAAIELEFQDKQLSIAVSADESTCGIDVRGEGVVAPFKSFINRGPFHRWKAVEGTFTTALSFQCTATQNWRALGELRVNDLKLVSSSEQWEMKVGNFLTWSEDEEKVEFALSDLSIIDREREDLVLLKELAWKGEMDPNFSFQGKGEVIALNQKGSAPLQFSAKGEIVNFEEWGVELTGERKLDSTIAFSYHQCGCKSQKMGLKSERGDALILSELFFLLRSEVYPLLSLSLQKGLIDLDLEVEKKGEELSIDLNHFVGQDLAGFLWGGACSAKSLEATFQGNGVQSRENATYHLKLSDGFGKWVTPQAKYLMENVDGQVDVQEGMIDSESFITFNSNGILGTLSFAEEMEISTVHMRLEGPLGVSLLSLPTPIETVISSPFLLNLERNLPDSEFVVIADLRLKNGKMDVEGKAELIALNKASSDLWEFTFEMPMIFPLTLKQGTLKGELIPIERYIPSAWLPDPAVTFSGNATVLATYENGETELQYQLKNALVEHPQFSLAIPFLQGDKFLPGHWGRAKEGGITRAYFPLEGASLLEKSHEMSVTEVTGDLYLSSEALSIPNFQGYLGEIYLQGGALLDLATNTVHAVGQGSCHRIRAVREVLGHWHLPALFDLPIEGIVSTAEEGIVFNTSWQDEKVDIDFTVSGFLEAGKMEARGFNTQLQDLSASFIYNYKADALEVEGLQGSVVMGADGKEKLYTLSSDQMTLHQFSTQEGSFDLWLGDRMGDLFRLVGKTKRSEKGGLLVATFDDHLTHIGSIHPEQFQFAVDSEGKLQQFNMDLAFSLERSLPELKVVEHLGLFPLPQSLHKAFQQVHSASGDIISSLNFDPNDRQFRVSMQGEGISFDDQEFGHLSMKGNYKENIWKIEQLELDVFSLAAELREEKDRIEIPFFGFYFGQSFLLGSKGFYLPSEDLLQVELSLVELALDHLKEWDSLRPLFERYDLKGELKARGSLSLKFLDEAPWYLVEASLDTSVNNLSCSGLQFEDCSRVDVHYQSIRGVEVSKFTSNIRPGSCNFTIPMTVEKGGYSIPHSQVWIQGGQVSLAQENTRAFIEHIDQSAPDHKWSFALQQFTKSQLDPQTQILFDLCHEPLGTSFHLLLSEGNYRIGGMDFPFEKMQIACDPLECRLDGQIRMANQPVCFTLRSALPSLKEGEMVLSLLSKFDESPEWPLLLLWERTENNRIAISRAMGKFGPLTCSLSEGEVKSDEAAFLEGRIQIDLKEMQELLPNVFATQPLSAGLCEWTGTLSLDPMRWGQSTFQGKLRAQEMMLFGSKWGELSSQIVGKKGEILFSDVNIHHPSGAFLAPIATLKQEGMDWHLYFPELTGRNLSPWIEPESSRLKEFEVDLIRLEGLDMVFGDSLTASAEGELSFHRESDLVEFSSFQTEFASDQNESEIWLPRSGQISFSLRPEQIELTGCQDVITDQKAIRYHLSKKYPSTVGFDGKLSLYLNVQPYHVLAPLAEFITVSVRGTLESPEVNFAKTASSSHSP